MNVKRNKLIISGIVQGVGFRPFVYNLALKYELVGFVLNNDQGVVIEIQGDEDNIDKFCCLLKDSPPNAAIIDSFIRYTDLDCIKHEDKFLIVKSSSSGKKSAGISPDLNLCSDCLKELFDENDRRYLYPFINCTNCGPRFSIIFDRPYDRKFTSMNKFIMCNECQKEYDEPVNRRFHAQPNACNECGPKVYFMNLSRQIVADKNDAIVSAVKELENGKILAIKGIGGFHLGIDAFNLESVARLREIKKRKGQSFALMYRNIESVKQDVELSKKEEELLTSSIAPILLLKKKNKKFEHICPDNNYLGIMLAYTPVHHLIFYYFSKDVLVMTSANYKDEPIIVSEDDFFVNKSLSPLCDFILSNDREILNRVDDSIYQVVKDRVMILRRSRGIVPKSIKIENSDIKERLAYGAELKNSFALLKNKEVFLSQHIGDLSDVRSISFQKEQIKRFSSLLEITPVEKVGDLHPGFYNYDEDNINIEHHYAHMLSVMAEHGLGANEQFLGVVIDGTGFGSDKTIWGMEFLLGDTKKFERVASLLPFALLSGEKAIKDISKIGFELLYNAGVSPTQMHRLHFPQEKLKQFLSLKQSGLNSFLTSSLGRLFDGIFAILRPCFIVEYEAQAAIKLQALAENCSNKGQVSTYKVVVQENKIDYRNMIVELVDDLLNKTAHEVIAYRFHLWVVDAILQIVDQYQAKKVIFSGGCLQNALLMCLLEEKLKDRKRIYYFNEKVPANDGGISLGQIIFEG